MEISLLIMENHGVVFEFLWEPCALHDLGITLFLHMDLHMDSFPFGKCIYVIFKQICAVAQNRSDMLKS